jgi:hypothetical protein
MIWLEVYRSVEELMQPVVHPTSWFPNFVSVNYEAVEAFQWDTTETGSRRGFCKKCDKARSKHGCGIFHYACVMLLMRCQNYFRRLSKSRNWILTIIWRNHHLVRMNVDTLARSAMQAETVCKWQFLRSFRATWKRDKILDSMHSTIMIMDS